MQIEGADFGPEHDGQATDSNGCAQGHAGAYRVAQQNRPEDDVSHNDAGKDHGNQARRHMARGQIKDEVIGRKQKHPHQDLII